MIQSYVLVYDWEIVALLWFIIKHLIRFGNLRYLVYPSKVLFDWSLDRHLSFSLTLKQSYSFSLIIFNRHWLVWIIIYNIHDAKLTGILIFALVSSWSLNLIRSILFIQGGSKLWHKKVVSQFSWLFCVEFLSGLLFFRFFWGFKGKIILDILLRICSVILVKRFLQTFLINLLFIFFILD